MVQGQKKVCVPKMGLISYLRWLLIQSFIFPGRNAFWFVAGGWFGLGGWVRQIPPPPPQDKHIHRKDPLSPSHLRNTKPTVSPHLTGSCHHMSNLLHTPKGVCRVFRDAIQVGGRGTGRRTG